MTKNGVAGTYNLGILAAPAPQVFNVSLPVSISNGVPASGAGNLETTASEDDYRFTLASAKRVQLALSSCTGLTIVSWSVVNDSTGVVLQSGTTCSTVLTNQLSAGTYRIVITRNGKAGTYQLGLSATT